MLGREGACLGENGAEAGKASRAREAPCWQVALKAKKRPVALLSSDCCFLLLFVFPADSNAEEEVKEFILCKNKTHPISPKQKSIKILRL